MEKLFEACAKVSNEKQSQKKLENKRQIFDFLNLSSKKTEKFFLEGVDRYEKGKTEVTENPKNPNETNYMK